MSIPVLFGLIGFIQPCSVGINAIFLGHLRGRNKLAEILKFAAVRSIFLAIFGLVAGLIGRVFYFQKEVLAAFYLLLGALFIVGRFKAVPMPNISLLGVLGIRCTPSALTFGLTVPACTVPLLMALLARAAFVGDLLYAPASLFVFGLALSLPIILPACSENTMERISRTVHVAPYIGGLALALMGIYALGW
jgi:cytochrome c-type biogenesis protein